MRKVSAALLSATALLVTGIASPAAAQPPPHRECPRGVHHAHATVPHETKGHAVAHQAIPHCPPHDSGA